VENEFVRACLQEHVVERRRRDAALMAAYYTDAAPVARRLAWLGSVELEAFGTKNDLLVAGVPKSVCRCPEPRAEQSRQVTWPKRRGKMSAQMSAMGVLSGLVLLTLSFVGHDPLRHGLAEFAYRDLWNIGCRLSVNQA
jgi:hypothetical protein